jgi:hypothetical protein
MSTKTNGKRRAPAKGAISREAAEAAWTRVSQISGPNEERWFTLVHSLLDAREDAFFRCDNEMALAAGITPQPAQALSALGGIVALRRLSLAQLFELGSSEEAMQLAAEVLARGFREPAAEVGKARVLRFPRWCWLGDPIPAEEPPEEEGDETYAPGPDGMVGLS